MVSHEETGQHEILQIKDNAISSVIKIKLDIAYSSIVLNLGVTNNDFWISTNFGFVFKVNKANHSIQQYRFSNDLEPSSIPKIISTATSIWLSMSNGKEVYGWNPASNNFTQYPYKPVEWENDEIIQAQAFKDLNENILVRYRSSSDAQSATLIDSKGQLLDYTPVLNDQNKIAGSNFKQQLITFDPGLRFVDVTNRKGVSTITGFKGSRGMVELDSQALHISAHSQRQLFSPENGAWKTKGNTISCLMNAFIDSEFIKDASGKIWFTTGSRGSDAELNYYEPATGACKSFDLGFGVYRFNILGDGRMVIGAIDSFYIWEEQTDKLVRICRNSSGKGLNQLFIDKDDFVWVATDQGLLKIDPNTNEQQWINLFSEEGTSVMRIHQDDRGRLWLGTTSNGVVIFTPSNGNMQVIDQSVGLSNNIVVSLLEDDEGDIWAGTFHGVSIISPEGEVTGKLYEEDGLANNECNRWSALKMKDGRLCFGAVKGATVIDPLRWKTPIEGFTPPKIYLTKLNGNASGKKDKQEENLLPIFRNKERIVLPANNRNLNSTFVLSNYASSGKSTFAYLLEGKENEWIYIGTQRQLSLNSLPAGRYNILIKGTDGRGNGLTRQS